MPKPRKGETYDHWMGRCIPILIEEGRPQDQAVAICISMWEEHSRKKGMFEGVLFGGRDEE